MKSGTPGTGGTEKNLCLFSSRLSRYFHPARHLYSSLSPLRQPGRLSSSPAALDRPHRLSSSLSHLYQPRRLSFSRGLFRAPRYLSFRSGSYISHIVFLLGYQLDVPGRRGGIGGGFYFM